MSYNNLSHRSTLGCLTCKQRKKKCDEAKPFCDRCIDGGFRCLGYTHLKTSNAPPLIQHSHTNMIAIPQPPLAMYQNRRIYPAVESVYSNSVFVPPEEEQYEDTLAWTRANAQPRIPRGLQFDPRVFDDIASLIVSQYMRLAPRVIFRPLPFSVEASVGEMARKHNMKRWSLYLGAMITRTLMDGTHQQNYANWIDQFRQQITGSSTTLQFGTSELSMRLSSLQDLTIYACMILNCRAGYTLLKQCAPIFLQLASTSPLLWSQTQNSAISIFHALHAPLYDLRKFALWDTMASLAFGIAPLVNYDTRLRAQPVQVRDAKVLEWVHGCPAMVVVLVSKVNAWRVSRWMNPLGTSSPNEWREVEAHLKQWTPGVDPVGESTDRVLRLAILEGWRQAVLIYLYMGMCGADSADPRVEVAVKQIVQLARTISPGNPLENHFFMPCLIAGVAARLEPHRKTIRKKISISRNENIWCLRGADFAPVLDRLWRGVGADGAPTRWEDYVRVRCEILPIDAS